MISASLTNEVVKSEKSAAELCHGVSRIGFDVLQDEASPLSPFMMTRILEPMHRSISSRGISWEAILFDDRGRGRSSLSCRPTPLDVWIPERVESRARISRFRGARASKDRTGRGWLKP
jgi:hypothetical protein